MTWSLSPTISHFLLRYYFGGDHLFKIRLFGFFHRLLGRPRFTIPYAERGWISLDMDDFIQFEILRSGKYECDVWAALESYAVQDEVVWDIGANVGSVGLSASASGCVREVHCFEPSPELFRALEYNARLNQRRRIVAHELALSDKNEVRPLFLGLRGNSGVAGFQSHWNTRSVPVQCITGEDCIRQGLSPVPTLIKIDVEGHEQSVLQGLESVLRSAPPKAVVFEGHLKENGESYSQPVLDYLAALGFQVWILPHPVGLHTVNYLALKGGGENQSELRRLPSGSVRVI